MSENDNWLSHGFKRAPSFFEAQAALSWGVIVALLAMVGVVYLSEASQKISSGYRLLEMASQLRELQKENTYLDAEIAAGQQLEQLRSQAIGLGFSPATPEDIEYLSVPNYPPTPGGPMVVLVSEPPDSERGLAGWWRGLAQGFTGWTRRTAGEGY
jgi:hypothetical protein